jgi:hypothetical protein
MVAAASAFALSLVWVGEPDDATTASLVVLIAMAGGAVEGAAVGVVQWLLLRGWLPGLSLRWVAVTVAAAVVGWMLGMVPSTVVSLAASETTPAASATEGSPPLWVMPLVGVGAGLVLGALFGLAQAIVLRHHVSNASLWVWANALGWAAAMAIMFTGAGIPSTRWPWPQLLPLAAATGVLAGLAVGAVTGAFLSRLRPRASRQRVELSEP